MPLPSNEDLKTIIEQRVNERLFDGYYGGVFNPTHDKFIGLTWVDLSTVEYEEYEWLHEQLSHSAMYMDFERAKKFISPNSWQSKTTAECIDESIYKYFSMTFIGVLYEDEWFIIKSLSFYGDMLSEAELKVEVEQNALSENLWDTNLFLPEKPLGLKGYINSSVLLPATSLEFQHMPWMVSIIKQEKKERINRAYIQYINEEFLEPFFQRMRISWPEKYVTAHGLKVGYTMIFPQHKKYALFCAFVKNKLDEWQLIYFLFNNEPRKFYKWTYFKSVAHDFSFFYGELIIDDLKQISHWNDWNYLDSSCTMDDQHFWDEFVFKQENNRYLYLEEIDMII